MIAISATGKKTRDLMDLCFARCPYYVLVDEQKSTAVENPFCNEEADVAKNVIDWFSKMGVKKVITGEVGPKAQELLQKKKIQIVLFDAEKISIQNIYKKMNF